MNKYLNIVHISTVHPDSDTRIFEKECRGLVAAGHRVTLIIQSDRTDVRDGVNVKALPKSRGRLHRMTVTMARAFCLVLMEKGDIYHLHDPELLPMGLILRFLGRKVVYDMHENLPEQIKDKHWIPVWLKRPLAATVRMWERVVLNYMGVVMAERSYSKSYKWMKRSEVILNLPMVDDLVNFAPKVRSTTPSVGYIGGVTRNRGALIIIDALQQIREEGLPVSYECIGPVDSEVASDKRFLRAVSEGWAVTPGRMSPRDGWPRIGHCQIGVAVLRSVGNYIESYPTKMFEYMAMGLPVVVSNFPLYREVVERYKCGICVDPDDKKAITEALRFLLENPDRAREMGQKGQKAVLQNYNWNRELGRLCNFYDSLINNPL